ncbi:shikimate dehydrogenase [Clostridium gasigenes]|uniref:shikimate dehydrogenase n=1 Tax=Clostridium gasigenes TaxID=94869 RepID=UPI00143842F7|nr:shikimate dehydrogenase [Clostridium gasigenes]NKF07510.1 shikimate dehydrogenase [Clostridium gasigenes]QSW17948.1 shikimate dehydrogenase [Clostridium gasigenes]
MEFYGLLGEKLSHSLSPKIHDLVFKAIGVSGGYKLFEVDRNNLEKFTMGLKVLNIKGSNVTIPYKEEVIKYLDEVSYEGKRIGAVNTISLIDGKLYGYNTDYYGFGYMLEAHNIKTNNKIAVILGNGGACKAALYYLLDNGIKHVYVVSRNSKVKTTFNEEKVSLISYNELKDLKGDILINSTPVGMYPKVDGCPACEEVICNFSTLIDLIYNPGLTTFLSKGKELGKVTVGGLYMLVGQAIKAQEIWQGISINKSIINDIYIEINKEF